MLKINCATRQVKMHRGTAEIIVKIVMPPKTRSDDALDGS